MAKNHAVKPMRNDDTDKMRFLMTSHAINGFKIHYHHSCSPEKVPSKCKLNSSANVKYTRPMYSRNMQSQMHYTDKHILQQSKVIQRYVDDKHTDNANLQFHNSQLFNTK